MHLNVIFSVIKNNRNKDISWLKEKYLQVTSKDYIKDKKYIIFAGNKQRLHNKKIS